MISLKSISVLFYVIDCTALFLLPASANAQETETYRIETDDGNIIIGELVSETEDQVTLRTESAGDITISRDNIKRMTLLDDARMQNDEYWHENPQSTRYLFAPSALGIKKGQGYYQNTWILFNNVNYGVTNNFSIGVGTIPLFLFGSPWTPF